MKRFCSNRWWVTSLVSLAFVFGLHDGAQAQQYKWKLGHVSPPVHPWHLASVEFAKGVEKDSNGRITVEIHHSGALGSEISMIEQARFGALDMCAMSTGSLRVLDPRLEIEELPYAWPTRQHAFRALDGELGNRLKSFLEPKGIVILAWMENGYRHMTNRVRPIYKPEDLKGLKIRTAELTMRLDTFRLLGVQPTPMAFPELFMALQQGTVDGQENPLVVIHSSKFYEVQKYLSLTGHIWSSADFMINKASWDKLPADLQTIVRQNAIRAGQYERQLSEKADLELIDELKKKGMQVNEVDTRPFKRATQPIYDKYRDTYGKDLMELVEKYSR